MEYESAIRKLREKWPVGRFIYNCVLVSNELGIIIQEEFPAYEVCTAISTNLDIERIGFIDHQVSVVRENDLTFIALDVTRPLHEKGQEYWVFEAGSIDMLMRKLSEHYTGDWKINQRYDPHFSRYKFVK